ncbi:SpoIIE family protein phosphatase [Kineococcus sp. SYSU DK002]|uniref:SpoIIE family protein phosphatase n=1 Tax=Kineococcus sp. SYSU DK002 TaxID=3383123 RepID=UPI003D7E2499
MDVQLDDLRVFHALPSPHVLLDRRLRVVRANDAYLRLLGRDAAAVEGRPLLDVLREHAAPPDRAPDRAPGPGGTAPGGLTGLHECLEQVLRTGRPESLSPRPFPQLDLGTGRWRQRWWSSVVAPVLDDTGEVAALIHRVEDITDYVSDRRDGARRRRAEERWQARTLTAEAELFDRVREIQVARDAERARTRELAALAEASVGVARAADVAELTDVVVDRGLAALGAQGGAVGVRSGDAVDLTITASLGAGIQLRYARLRLDDPLPVAVTATTGRRILLPDLAATLAYGHGAQEIVEISGCRAWACLPLTTVDEAGDQVVLGALLVGWKQAQTFTAAALGVLEAFAAQCAQTLARLRVREAEQLQAERTWRLAQALQRSLLAEPVQPDGLRVVTRYRAAAERAQVGGDWYDGFVTSTGVSTLVVGDVCGHDREAAAAMAQVRNLLRGIAYTVSHPPAGILRAVDRAVAGLGVPALATAVVLSVEQDEELAAAGRHRLRWSNAGHPPPVVVGPDRRLRILRTEAELLLGLDPGTARTDHEVVVEAGSTVLLYSDGLIERRSADIDEGLAWLAATVEGHVRGLARGEPVDLDGLCDRLLTAVRETGEVEDDVVLLALRT